MKLDPVSLRLFVAVMEENTIAAAAAREHLAASAVSRRLADLEDALRVDLFTRSNRGATPTAAAFALLHLARGVLNDLDGIASQMREYGTGVRGHVRVVANISAITQFLPGELQSFLALHPQVDVRLQEQISTSIAQSVAENAADVGILNDGNYGDRITLLPYRTDELVLVVPTGHALARRKAVAMTEALAFDFVGVHPGSAINNQLTRAAAEAGLPLRLRRWSTSRRATLDRDSSVRTPSTSRRWAQGSFNVTARIASVPLYSAALPRGMTPMPRPAATIRHSAS